MDLNQKIAHRRAELQQEQVTEDVHKKEAAHQQFLQREAEGKELERLAALEAATRVKEIETRLASANRRLPLSNDPRVGDRADKKVNVHIRKLAISRITKAERWEVRVLFITGFIGFFVEPWLLLLLWGFAVYYRIKVIRIHAAVIRDELRKQ